MSSQSQVDADSGKGTNAWDVYVAMAECADKDLTESWEKGIDVLLVYAALFSSVLATFLSQSFALAQPNPADITNALLLQFLHRDNMTLSYPTLTLSETKSATATLWINALWFISLICSLSASFFAILARQWIQEYKRWMSSHLDDLQAKARLRHFRYIGIQRWRVGTIIWTLPFILHLSLILFFAGLVLFSFQAHRVIGIVSSFLVALTITLYTTTIILPFLFTQCPFQTPLIRPLQNLFLHVYRSILQAPIHLSFTIPAFISFKSDLQRHLAQHIQLAASGRKEEHIINTTQETLDAQVLATLISTSWDHSNRLIATSLTSLSASTQDARDVLRATNATHLIEKRYLALLRFGNNYPHLSIAAGSEGDAYTYLRALLYLFEHDAVPQDWRPSKRLRRSLDSCMQAEDRNMRSVVLSLVDRLDVM